MLGNPLDFLLPISAAVADAMTSSSRRGDNPAVLRRHIEVLGQHIDQLIERLKVNHALLDKQEALLDKKDALLDKKDALLDEKDDLLDEKDDLLDEMTELLDEKDELLKKFLADWKQERARADTAGEKAQRYAGLSDRLARQAEFLRRDHTMYLRHLDSAYSGRLEKVLRDMLTGYVRSLDRDTAYRYLGTGDATACCLETLRQDVFFLAIREIPAARAVEYAMQVLGLAAAAQIACDRVHHPGNEASVRAFAFILPHVIAALPEKNLLRTLAGRLGGVLVPLAGGAIRGETDPDAPLQVLREARSVPFRGGELRFRFLMPKGIEAYLARPRDADLSPRMAWRIALHEWLAETRPLEGDAALFLARALEIAAMPEPENEMPGWLLCSPKELLPDPARVDWDGKSDPDRWEKGRQHLRRSYLFATDLLREENGLPSDDGRIMEEARKDLKDH